MPAFDDLQASYATQWKTMVVLPQWAFAVEQAARRIVKNKARYQMVEAKTGVPWFFIGTINELESGGDFSTFLGNGEPLDRKTRLVPKGRGPFKTWEAGAIDAIKYDGLDKVKSWQIERIAYQGEGYNGWGYHNHGAPSAYLWSGSNVYKGGKYIADGVWSASAKSQQVGIMPLLRVMAAIDSSIQIGVPTASVPVPGSVFVDRVAAAMKAKGYRIDTGPGEINLVYIESYNRDGTKNDGKPDLWNDVHMVFTYEGGKPVAKGSWTCTTQPGFYYTEHPLNPEKGAANIKPGQYTAWRVGLHRGQYEALVQRGKLTLTRDKNKDYEREGDREEIGEYQGINQHHGNNAATVGPHSAGCLTSKMVDGHEDKMRIVKSDPRFLANHSFMFTTAILAQGDVP
jgi:lysozyme family protein